MEQKYESEYSICYFAHQFCYRIYPGSDNRYSSFFLYFQRTFFKNLSLLNTNHQHSEPTTSSTIRSTQDQRRGESAQLKFYPQFQFVFIFDNGQAILNKFFRLYIFAIQILFELDILILAYQYARNWDRFNKINNKDITYHDLTLQYFNFLTIPVYIIAFLVFAIFMLLLIDKLSKSCTYFHHKRQYNSDEDTQTCKFHFFDCVKFATNDFEKHAYENHKSSDFQQLF